MARGQYTIATLYEVSPGKTATAEKSYWNRSTADSHYSKTLQRDGIIALVMYNPDGVICRSWNRAREK